MKTRLGILGLALALVASAADDAKNQDAAPGTSFRVPYKLTNTNHYLVRVRVNGKGPFNFLVDTGAPALYVGTEAAKAIGLEAAKDSFWTPDRPPRTRRRRLALEPQGPGRGPVPAHRHERSGAPRRPDRRHPRLHRPGEVPDGVRPRRSDRMVWTRLDYNPKEPFVPAGNPNDRMPAEVQMMNAMGPAMKLAAVFVGKQAEDMRLPRGSLGIGLAEEPKGELLVASILAGSPAEKAGLKVGDRILKLAGKEIDSSKSAHAAVASLKVGDRVEATVRREGNEMTIELTAAEGF